MNILLPCGLFVADVLIWNRVFHLLAQVLS